MNAEWKMSELSLNRVAIRKQPLISLVGIIFVLFVARNSKISLK